jgi:CDP-2,3-bis-(O-geranylgeranyl)-sn-glycerol synthase
MNDYIAALLFFLPAGLANMTPPVVNKVPWINQWKTPLDFGNTWRGKRLLGDNKTWRGIVCGTIVGAISAVIISKLNTNTVVTIAPLYVGILLGFGALAGDAVESFFKRQLGFKPGQPWFPFDQIDYIFGALLIILPFVSLQLWSILTIVLVYFGLHLLTAYLGYLLKLKDSPI